MKNWEKYEEISTHAPHARRGVHLLLLFHRLIDFYSRASCEARLNLSKSTFRFFDFYSRASCEARLCLAAYRFLELRISTHAPHARRGV